MGEIKLMIKYSFIIPVKEINNYVRESIPKILAIKRDDFEIIVYPDKITDETWPKTRQIATGSVGPDIKRGLAMHDARGEFLVFIDDDAYPRKNILDILDEDFKDIKIAAVGGPALTPPSDSFLQKVSGAVFLSFFSGGFPERYYPKGKKRYVMDWPTVNLTVRKEVFVKIGGFTSGTWPGEDTKFCLDIISKLKENNKILYDPRIIVWHHRREGLGRHLNQIAGYGLHRGFFAKRYPLTSFQFRYFLPSIFLLFVVIGAVLSYLFPVLTKFYLLGWLIYAIAMIKAIIDVVRIQKSFEVALYSLVYVIFTHLVYGFRFIQGFVFTKELKKKLK